jgi:hydroxymethylbilane synthase
LKTLRLGTRKSALAQAQAHWTAGALRAAFPELQVEIVLITTSGDRLQTEPSPYPLPEGRGPTSGQGVGLLPSGRRWPEGPDEGKGGLKALFTKEIEEALLDHRIDLAVHSLKDMSAELPQGLALGAVPEREDPRDVWISKTKQVFQTLTGKVRIGTGAVRRQAQLRHLLPACELIAIRGNVDTRLRKLTEGDLDGIILALAGLKRLGKAQVATEILPIDTLLPAVGQGCLGIQIRDRDAALLSFMKALDHAPSHAAALCERAFLKTLGGTCQTPIAGHASIEGGELTMKGLVTSPDGQERLSARENGRPFDAAGIGQRLAQKLLDAGADKIL